ncbi:hypothetical protein [Neisseria sp. GT4A_CT1]|uniref:hypothetical protein n=1 Tax=Neisseria sp. GT4A_CT1 TaxID=665946 RepID=UPI00143A607E|nr:hypothetical protein [Neisseria sp. GT4A_CT1]
MENNKLEANAATSPFEKSVIFRRPCKNLIVSMGNVKRNFIFSTFEEIEKLNANPAVSTYYLSAVRPLSTSLKNA